MSMSHFLTIHKSVYDQILEDGLKKIAIMIKEQGGPCFLEQAMKLPFRCWGCNEMCHDLYLITGDGLGMCTECFNSAL